MNWGIYSLLSNPNDEKWLQIAKCYIVTSCPHLLQPSFLEIHGTDQQVCWQQPHNLNVTARLDRYTGVSDWKSSLFFQVKAFFLIYPPLVKAFKSCFFQTYWDKSSKGFFMNTCALFLAKISAFAWVLEDNYTVEGKQKSPLISHTERGPVSLILVFVNRDIFLFSFHNCDNNL